MPCEYDFSQLLPSSYHYHQTDLLRTKNRKKPIINNTHRSSELSLSLSLSSWRPGSRVTNLFFKKNIKEGFPVPSLVGEPAGCCSTWERMAAIDLRFSMEDSYLKLLRTRKTCLFLDTRFQELPQRGWKKKQRNILGIAEGMQRKQQQMRE